MSEITDTVNLICTKRDGKRTMHYLLMFFLVGWITFGIGWLVWGHRLSARIGVEQAARRLPVTMTAGTFWLWNILGAFIIIGPLVYTYKLLHAMNDLCADYNQRGWTAVNPPCDPPGIHPTRHGRARKPRSGRAASGKSPCRSFDAGP